MYGWLSPSGQFIEVADAGFHHDIMEDVIDLDVLTAESIGWIHLSGSDFMHCGKGINSRITPEQRRWLVQHDYELREDD